VFHGVEGGTSQAIESFLQGSNMILDILAFDNFGDRPTVQAFTSGDGADGLASDKSFLFALLARGGGIFTMCFPRQGYRRIRDTYWSS
jgi:hypothetical protein